MPRLDRQHAVQYCSQLEAGLIYLLWSLGKLEVQPIAEIPYCLRLRQRAARVTLVATKRKLGRAMHGKTRDRQ